MYQFFSFQRFFVTIELIEYFIHHHVAIWLSGEKPNMVSTEKCDHLQVVKLGHSGQLGLADPPRVAQWVLVVERAETARYVKQ